MEESEPAQRKIEAVFGQVVRERRWALDMSQEEVSLEANIHRTFLSEIERGIKSPTLSTLEALARALQTLPSDLLAEVERRRIG